MSPWQIMGTAIGWILLVIMGLVVFLIFYGAWKQRDQICQQLREAGKRDEAEEQDTSLKVVEDNE